jgi:hypothetical protein
MDLAGTVPARRRWIARLEPLTQEGTRPLANHDLSARLGPAVPLGWQRASSGLQLEAGPSCTVAVVDHLTVINKIIEGLRRHP